jgi:23S rRNA pseudouridine2605 synthase
MKQRLNKIIAQSGICSRRSADDLIRAQRVLLNNAVVTELGTLADPEQDTIVVNGELLTTKKLVYILLNKPVGYTCTTRYFRNEKNVLSLIPDVEDRIYPVGRLDKDTSGLLILTNDGDLSYTLTHPKFTIDRTYEVGIGGTIMQAEIFQLERGGLTIDDYETSPCSIKVLERFERSTTLHITLHEGKKREIRKMFGQLGHPVQTLKRLQYGKLKLGNLAPGDWRYIKKEDIL